TGTYPTGGVRVGWLACAYHARLPRCPPSDSDRSQSGFPHPQPPVFTHSLPRRPFKIIHDILPYGEQWQRLGEYIKQALGQIGTDVTLRREDVPSWLKRIFTNYEFDLTSDFYYNLADPVLGVHRQYLTDQIRQGTVFVNS